MAVLPLIELTGYRNIGRNREAKMDRLLQFQIIIIPIFYTNNSGHSDE